MRKLRNFIQRGLRGYCDEDLWNLDSCWARIIHNSIKDFKKMERFGYSAQVNNQKDWEKILDEIVIGMEAGERISNLVYYENKKVDENTYSYTFNKEKQSKDIKLYNRGWKLVQKYIGNLWD